MIKYDVKLLSLIMYILFLATTNASQKKKLGITRVSGAPRRTNSTVKPSQ